MKKAQLGFTATELMVCVGAVVALAGAVGWVWNIVKLVGMSFDPLTGLLAVRIVGIFVPPLGAVVGYF